MSSCGSPGRASSSTRASQKPARGVRVGGGGWTRTVTHCRGAHRRASKECVGRLRAWEALTFHTGGNSANHHIQNTKIQDKNKGRSRDIRREREGKPRQSSQQNHKSPKTLVSQQKKKSRKKPRSLEPTISMNWVRACGRFLVFAAWKP